MVATRYIENVHLTFNLEAGLLLPFVLKYNLIILKFIENIKINFLFRGRIRHGRHFTFRSLNGKATITFVSPSVSGSAVSDENPFVAHETWLQVLVPNSFMDTMESSLKFLNEPVLVNLFIILLIKILCLFYLLNIIFFNFRSHCQKLSTGQIEI